MPQIPWILIATAVLLVIGAIIAIITIRRSGDYSEKNLSANQTHKADQKPYPPPEQPQQEEKEKKRKIILAIILGLTVLMVIGTIVFKETGIRTGGGSGNDDSGFPFFVLFPIWIALIPALKKNKKPVSPNRKKVLIAIVILTVLLVLGTALFVFLRAK
ncbi:hypothetical protein HQ544_04550 [Candidatus Falkowbacteria bacterium]|nr:hypothetical protein [Candidatus Falkowbacteria bacterium]